MIDLSGTHTALITPFQEAGEDRPIVDFKSLERLVIWQLSRGVSGFVVCGTTGESPTLDQTEKLELITFVRELVQEKALVIAGTGSNSTSQTVDFTQAAKDSGAQAALVVSPYYNKPPQRGLIEHFSRVADCGGLPVILYNVPGRTGVPLEVGTVAELSQHSNIVGIKESSNSADNWLELARLASDEFQLLTGDDHLYYHALTCNARGTISASANVLPEAFVRIADLYGAGRAGEALQEQLRILPMIRLLFSETSPIPAKAALKIMSIIDSDILRLPLVRALPQTVQKLVEELEVNGF